MTSVQLARQMAGLPSGRLVLARLAVKIEHPLDGTRASFIGRRLRAPRMEQLQHFACSPSDVLRGRGRIPAHVFGDLSRRVLEHRQ
jgi:hypothetical protein